MKVRTALRKICEHCKLVKRGKKNLVICSVTPKHKQRQGFSTLAGQPAEGMSLYPVLRAGGAMSFAEALGLQAVNLDDEDL